ncbi:MAG TPA: response regulator [Polyangiaceae bacterium]
MGTAKQNSETSLRDAGHPAVLIVEDNEDARFEMATLLRGDGFAVTETADAEEGLRALRVRAYDLILLDLWLPGMNGWSFRAEQRAEKTLSTIPVVVMTADSSPQAQVIDADAVLQKPFGAELLTQTIRKVLAARTTQANGATDLVSDALTLMANAMGHEVGNALMGLTYTIENARTDSTKGSSTDQDLGLMLDDCRRIGQSLRTLRELPRATESGSTDCHVHSVRLISGGHAGPTT